MAKKKGDATIISAALDDNELRRSIQDLVNVVENQTKMMATSFDNAVTKMTEALRGLNSVGAKEAKESRSRTRASEAEAAAVKKTAMSYNQLLSAMQMLQRRWSTGGHSTSDFIKILEEYERLERQMMSKRSEMTMEYVKSHQFTPDMSAYAKSLTEVNPELQQLIKYYRELERAAAAANRETRRSIQGEYMGARTMPVNTLGDALRQLQRMQSVQAKMQQSGLFNEAELNRAQKTIDNIRKNIEKLRRTGDVGSMSSILGMPEKTLNDISLKMQAISRYRASLSTTAPEIRTLNAEYQRLSKMQNEVLGNNIRLQRTNDGLARSFGYIRNRIVYAFTIGAAMNFTKQLYEVRGQYELLERSIGVLVNSMQRGREIFRELSDMAIKSPFTLIELGTAAKQLTAYNFSAREVVDTTRRLADISAALGVPMERLTYNLGQIRAQTVLTARDARDFANAGLPIVKSLSDYYTELEGRVVSTGEVYDRMSRKMVSFNDVMAVMNKMTDEGGRFFDFQAKQADTLRVQLANLGLAFNNMLNAIGEENQERMTAPLRAARKAFENWKTIVHVLNEVIAGLGAYKAAQLLANAAVGEGNIVNTKQILAQKRAKATLLERKALTERLTVDEMRLLATRRQVTAQDYQMVLASKQLTKQQALMLAALNSRNKAFLTAMIRTKQLTAEEIRNITAGRLMTIVFRQVGISIKGMAASMATFMATNWPFLVAGIAYELISAFAKGKKANEELTESIVQNAKTASEEINRYLSSNQSIMSLAQGGGLDKGQAQKAWESLKEQIESSSSAADEFITRLMSIEDINKRVVEGFRYAQAVEAANAALSELQDDAIKVSRTRWVGILGEGLVDDIKDFAAAADAIKNNFDAIRDIEENFNLERRRESGIENYYTNLYEMRDEVNKTVKSVKDELEKSGLTDPDAVREYLAQVKRTIIAETPGMKGIIADMFSIEFDRAFGNQEDALMKVLMRQLQKSTSAFQGINDAWVKGTGTLSEKQEKDIDNAIDNALDYFKRTMPQYYDAVEAMVKDASKLRINIGLTFGAATMDDFLQEYTKRVNELFPSPTKGGIENRQRLMVFQPKERQDFVTWVNDMQSAIESLEKANEQYSKKNTEWSRGRIEANNNEIKSRTEALALFGIGPHKDKQGKGDDTIANAIRSEISLIKELQANYDKLRKVGVDDMEAITLAGQGYEDTIKKINDIMSRYGVPLFSVGDFAGRNTSDIITLLQRQRDILARAKGIKLGDIQALDVEIGKLSIDAKAYDLNKLTEGMNNELSKLKDEYELSLQLDADPTLGNMFMDMFGVDTSTFPKTIDEYMNRVQKEFNKTAEMMGYNTPLDVFKTSEEGWRQWAQSVGMSEEALKTFNTKFIEAQGVVKKWAQDTIRQTQDLQYKLGDLNQKIEIEVAKLGVLEERAANETNDSMRTLLLLQIQQQKDAIEKLKMESIKLLPFYEKLFGDIYNASTRTLKNIVADARAVMSPRQGGEGLGYEQRTDEKGRVVYDVFAPDTNGEIKKTTISLEEFLRILKQIDSLQDKIIQKNPWEKIKDSFSKLEKGGVKNFSEGVKGIGDELSKLASLVKTIGDIAEVLGIDEGTVEVVNDISESIEGVGQAAKGIGQIAAGDYLGGIVNVVQGTFKAISTWFDNSEKRIKRQIEEHERWIAQLERQYKSLEYQVERTFGAQELAARRALIANKKLQRDNLAQQIALSEQLERQLRGNAAVEAQRETTEKLKSQLEEIDQEMWQLSNDIATMLLGSDIKSAAESFVDTWVQAWRAGESTMDALEGKFDEMIDNMIMKAIASKVVAQRLKPVFDFIDTLTGQETDAEMLSKINSFKKYVTSGGIATDIDRLLQVIYEALGIGRGSGASASLSQLQQGIRGITESQAGALEAYWNANTQQQYLHTDLLTQIRDMMVGMDYDASLDIQTQILFQMQQSYQVQMTIQTLLSGWSSNNGRSVRVEMI